MKKILFVCQANIGRSQMAEAFYNHLTGTNDAISAACQDFREKYHHQITAEIIDTMKDVGIDISQQQIKLVTPELIETAQKVILLCDQQYCPDFLAQSDKLVIKTIADPHLKSVDQIAKIREQIKKIVIELI